MIVIVGETANTNFTRKYSLEELLEAGAFVSGPSRTRLDSLGLQVGKVRSLNLCSPGRWDPEEAVPNAQALINKLADELATYRHSHITNVLAFGQRCSMSFGLLFDPLSRSRQWWATQPHREVNVIACPHPSGLSRWWNDHKNVRLFKEMIHGLA